MNYHTDEWIINKLKEHYEEAKTIVPEDNIVGIFLQGSQNYGLDFETSDVDTKLIVTPTLDDLIYNKDPLSYTYIRKNNEHIDIKDIRLYMDCFRKQNINFVEILFTKYKILNPKYEAIFSKLIDKKEAIARMDTLRAVKCIVGTTINKYDALEHRFPSREAIIDKYGYDPKQLVHMYRQCYFLADYISGEPYEACLNENLVKYNRYDWMCEVKNGEIPYKQAKEFADEVLRKVNELADEYVEKEHNKPMPENYFTCNDLLKQVQHDIMYKSIKSEVDSK